MTISEIKKSALKSLQGKWGLAVLLTFLLFLVNSLASSVVEIILSGGFTNWLWQEQTPPAADIVNIIITIVLLPPTIASTWFYLNLSRSEDAKISHVFAIYKNGKTSLKIIGASILVFIFILLWSLLLIIPGIIKAIAYSQTFFLLKDHPEYTVLEAITESRRRMKGYKWKYFLMNLSFIGWGILAVLSLGIGFLWLSPYISAANATFYNELIGSTLVNE
ncbi:hypothetical protein CU633_20170 [Bacillus sp. V3-13]|nr:hypothetical protein CU633_20170 [Bacillus sp. V3-13]